MKLERSVELNELTEYRFWLGICVFIVGFMSSAFIPLVAAAGLSFQWKATIVSALVFGIPEVSSLLGVATVWQDSTLPAWPSKRTRRS